MKNIRLIIFILLPFIFGSFYFIFFNTPTEVSSSLSPKVIDSTTIDFLKYNESIVTQERKAIEYFIKKYKIEYSVTERGVYYHVYNSGDGRSPKVGSKVKIRYTLYFLNETQVCETEEETINVGGGIPMTGIDDGIRLIKLGGRVRLIIPFNWAYGVSGRLPDIPPYTPLLCDLELVNYEN